MNPFLDRFFGYVFVLFYLGLTLTLSACQPNSTSSSQLTSNIGFCGTPDDPLLPPPAIPNFLPDKSSYKKVYLNSASLPLVRPGSEWTIVLRPKCVLRQIKNKQNPASYKVSSANLKTKSHLKKWAITWIADQKNKCYKFSFDVDDK